MVEVCSHCPITNPVFVVLSPSPSKDQLKLVSPPCSKNPFAPYFDSYPSHLTVLFPSIISLLTFHFVKSQVINSHPFVKLQSSLIQKKGRMCGAAQPSIVFTYPGPGSQPPRFGDPTGCISSTPAADKSDFFAVNPP